MSIFSDYACGAMNDFEFHNACTRINNAEHDDVDVGRKVEFCTRCGWEIDYHGAFDIDGDHLCWSCFKKEDLKDQRDWEDDEEDE